MSKQLVDHNGEPIESESACRKREFKSYLGWVQWLWIMVITLVSSTIFNFPYQTAWDIINSKPINLDLLPVDFQNDKHKLEFRFINNTSRTVLVTGLGFTSQFEGKHFGTQVSNTFGHRFSRALSTGTDDEMEPMWFMANRCLLGS
jgi:hypothetical protein